MGGRSDHNVVPVPARLVPASAAMPPVEDPSYWSRCAGQQVMAVYRHGRRRAVPKFWLPNVWSKWACVLINACTRAGANQVKSATSWAPSVAEARLSTTTDGRDRGSHKC